MRTPSKQVPLGDDPPGGAVSFRATRIVAEAGMVLALATVLKLAGAKLGWGGSVTPASLAPLWAFSLRHGWQNGCLLGSAFGVLNLLQHPIVVHWVQGLLDYPVAFLTVGLAGVRWMPAPAGIALSAAARYLIHVVAGVAFFGSMAPAGTPALCYSATYNLYVLPDAVLAAAALAALARRVPGLLSPQEAGSVQR